MPLSDSSAASGKRRGPDRAKTLSVGDYFLYPDSNLTPRPWRVTATSRSGGNVILSLTLYADGVTSVVVQMDKDVPVVTVLLSQEHMTDAFLQ